MTSAAPPVPPTHPASQQQSRQNPQQQQQHHQYTASLSSQQNQSTVSPPNKRDLKSWWKGFKLPSKHQETHGTATPSARSRPHRSTSLFVEDLECRYSALPSSVAQLHGMVAAGGGHHPQPASARRMNLPPAAALPRRHRSDAFVHILNWRLRSSAAGSCLKLHPLERRLTVSETRPQGIFGVPLRQSITYANVAISLIDENEKSYIYGYVPIVVAKCGVFLKEKGMRPHLRSFRVLSW